MDTPDRKSPKQEAKRLLLVDDDRLVLATLGEGLRHYGYEVVLASSGEQALALAETENLDLAILDIRMPGMSGIETARHLRERRNIPCLILSAYGDHDMVRDAVAQGALGYVVKPVDVAQLIPTIETSIGQAREMYALREREAGATRALGQGRDTSTAVGLVMERYRLNRDQAFELLRSRARSQRRKLEELSFELVKAAEKLSFPAEAVDRARGPKSSE
jgi:response regulator NasT